MIVKQGDRYAVTFTANADLTSGDVKILAKRGNRPVVELAVTARRLAGGSTELEHLLTGTLPAGRYRVWVEAGTDDTGPVTFPSRQDPNAPQYVTLEVLRDRG